MLCSVSCAEPDAPTYENLVILVVDTLRSDHLSGYGYERDTAPHLAKMGREGIQLDGYSSSSWTKPSVATLLTGLDPQAHQAIERVDSLPVTVPYLPSLLAEEGFATAAFVANLNVGRKFGFARGYDQFKQVRGSAKLDAVKVNRRTLGLVEQLAPPYFLYVHYVDPHDPYEPRHPWPGTETGPGLQPRRIVRRKIELTPTLVAGLVDRYDAEILEVDAAIDELVGQLDKRGLIEDTLIVVTSDHGEEFGDHGRLTHGRSLYQEVIRVPFLLWARGHQLSLPAETKFHHIDALPTLLEALGQEIPGELMGTSRWREFNGMKAETPADETHYFHLDLDGVGALAAIHKDEKLIHQNRGAEMLGFDLGDDPGELSPSEGVLAEATPLLRDLFRHHNAASEVAAASQQSELDQETRAALEAMGYLDSGTPDDALAGRTVPAKLGARGIPRGRQSRPRPQER